MLDNTVLGKPNGMTRIPGQAADLLVSFFENFYSFWQAKKKKATRWQDLLTILGND